MPTSAPGEPLIARHPQRHEQPRLTFRAPPGVRCSPWLYARSPMQFKVFEPGIDVHGSSVDAFVEAFKLFPSVILRRLVSSGIGPTNPKGDVTIDRASWYPQTNWL